VTLTMPFSSSYQAARPSGSAARRWNVPWDHLSDGHWQQSAESDDVVRGRGEGEDPRHEVPAAVAQLAQAADRLHPPEALLHELPLPLTERVAGVPRGARIDRAAAARRVLRQVPYRRGSRRQVRVSTAACCSARNPYLWSNSPPTSRSARVVRAWQPERWRCTAWHVGTEFVEAAVSSTKYPTTMRACLSSRAD
jgi:hypothetical protein